MSADFVARRSRDIGELEHAEVLSGNTVEMDVTSSMKSTIYLVWNKYITMSSRVVSSPSFEIDRLLRHYDDQLVSGFFLWETLNLETLSICNFAGRYDSGRLSDPII